MRTQALVAALVALPLSSCSALEGAVGFFREPTPDVERATQAAGAGARVSMPGNWRVSHDTGGNEVVKIHTMTIESSGSALATVQAFSPAIDLDAVQYLKDVADGMQRAVADMTKGVAAAEVGPITRERRAFLGAEREALRTIVTLHVLGERVPTAVTLCAARTPTTTVTLTTTIAVEDEARVVPGFELIASSLAVDGAASAP
jgi:hypothetical protein